MTESGLPPATRSLLDAMREAPADSSPDKLDLHEGFEEVRVSHAEGPSEGASWDHAFELLVHEDRRWQSSGSGQAKGAWFELAGVPISRSTPYVVFQSFTLPKVAGGAHRSVLRLPSMHRLDASRQPFAKAWTAFVDPDDADNLFADRELLSAIAAVTPKKQRRMLPPAWSDAVPEYPKDVEKTLSAARRRFLGLLFGGGYCYAVQYTSKLATGKARDNAKAVANLVAQHEL